MKIVFMGTPDFSVQTLERLINSRHEVIAVFCQPDRAVGRKAVLTPPPVKVTAEKYGIKVYQPERIRDEEYVTVLGELSPDLAVVAAYGQILSKQVLEIPRYGCINVHASLLPKYRGATPIQMSIINGDEKTGVTIMQMDEGLDTGDILLQREVIIAPDETGDSLFEKLAPLGADMAVEAADLIAEGGIHPVPQPRTGEKNTRIIKKEMGNICWSDSAAAIERRIRAFDSWPGTYSFLGGRMLKVKRAEVTEVHSSSAPGTVESVQGGLYVATNDFLLKLSRVQPAGKREMTDEEYLRGNRLSAGEVFGETV